MATIPAGFGTTLPNPTSALQAYIEVRTMREREKNAAAALDLRKQELDQNAQEMDLRRQQLQQTGQYQQGELGVQQGQLGIAKQAQADTEAQTKRQQAGAFFQAIADDPVAASMVNIDAFKGTPGVDDQLLEHVKTAVANGEKPTKEQADSLRKFGDMLNPKGADEQKANYLVTPGGLWSIKENKIMPGTEPPAKEQPAGAQERETKIKDLMANHGKSRQEATDIVDNFQNTKFDPISGQNITTNTASGQTTIAQPDQAQVPATGGESTVPVPMQSSINANKPSMYKMASLVSGPESKVQSIVGPALQWMGADTVQNGKEYARNYFETEKAHFLLSMRMAYGGRSGGASAIKPLEEALQIDPKAWDSWQLLQQRMIAVRDQLTGELQDARSTIAAGGPRQQIANAKEAQTAISNFLETLDVPKNAQMGKNTQSATASPKTKAEYDQLPSGTTYVDPNDGKTYIKK